jgi:xanthosine utilization system XapX-like protein
MPLVTPEGKKALSPEDRLKELLAEAIADCDNEDAAEMPPSSNEDKRAAQTAGSLKEEDTTSWSLWGLIAGFNPLSFAAKKGLSYGLKVMAPAPVVMAVEGTMGVVTGWQHRTEVAHLKKELAKAKRNEAVLAMALCEANKNKASPVHR